jgi:hypothetical protein
MFENQSEWTQVMVDLGFDGFVFFSEMYALIGEKISG